jgi:hypothetical protein
MYRQELGMYLEYSGYSIIRTRRKTPHVKGHPFLMDGIDLNVLCLYLKWKSNDVEAPIFAHENSLEQIGFERYLEN